MSEPMDRSAMIDAYLDDAMSGTERVAFDRSLAGDEALSRELELQRRIDGRLRALVVVPRSPALPGEGGSMRIGPEEPRARRWPTWARLAALLALCALGAWGALNQPWKRWMGPAPSDVAANVVFAELVKGGLRPQWKCDSDEIFAKYTMEKLAVTFTIKPKPGVEVVGWTYTSGLLDSSAQVLMCRVDGKASIVVIGRVEDDRAMHADAASGVQVHRKERWGLVMYELNQRPDAPVLGLMTGPGCSGR